VCSFADPATEVRLDEIDPRIDVVQAAPSECVERASPGGTRRMPPVDAATASDALLLAYVAGRPLEIVGPQLTTEGFAPAVPDGATSFVNFVSAVIGEAKLEGDYMEMYDRWVAPLVQDPLTEPPELTVTEAAALHPIVVPGA